MKHRKPSTDNAGNPFGFLVVDMVWLKGLPGDDPKIRYDACGAAMHYDYYGRADQKFGWEIDHIRPLEKGGSDDLTNLQPLQWENNRLKGEDFPAWQCRRQDSPKPMSDNTPLCRHIPCC